MKFLYVYSKSQPMRVKQNNHCVLLWSLQRKSIVMMMPCHCNEDLWRTFLHFKNLNFKLITKKEKMNYTVQTAI